MNRREFLLAAAAAPVALRMRAASHPLAYATADNESNVAVVDMLSGTIVRRIETLPSPFSIERVGETAVVAHTVSGRLTIIGRHVVEGLGEPRYTAAAPDGRHAFVTDSGHKELVTVDVLRGKVVGHVKLSQWPRHLSLAPDGRTLWVGLGTSTDRIDIVDVSDPLRPQRQGSFKPPFLAHDVGFAPSGGKWITSGNSSFISARGHVLPAGKAPQHVTFLDGRAYVTSGADGTLRVYDERTARLVHTAGIPIGSYNVQFAAGKILTASLARGTLCVVDPSGHVNDIVRIGSSSHDACLASA